MRVKRVKRRVIGEKEMKTKRTVTKARTWTSTTNNGNFLRKAKQEARERKGNEFSSKKRPK